MQAVDNQEIARRPLDVEDYLDIARRHRGWILGPLFGALVVSVVVAFLWPDTFVSSASLRVVSPTLDPRLAETPIIATLSDRINSMAQTILSRTVLETVIRTHDLYPKDVKKLPIEDVIETMKKNVQISPLTMMAQNANRANGVAAFSVSFRYADRYKAQKVVTDLVGRFITENQKEKNSGVYLGLKMFQDQVEQAQKDLDQAERRLAEFRTANQGRLPDQVDSNLQQMTAIQTRLSMLNGAISRAQQEKMGYETNLTIEQERRRQIKEYIDVSETSERAKNDRLMQLEKDVQSMELVVATLAEQYTEKHPDLQAARSRLANLKKERESLAREEKTKKPENVVTKRVADPQSIRLAQEHDANITRFRAGVEMKTKEIEDLTKEAKDLNIQIRSLDSRIQGIPLSEKQYAEIIRERDLAKERFLEAKTKYNKMQSGEEVENRKLGELLEQLDSPSLPQTPAEPKRPAIVAIGTIAGLLLGLVVAGAREVKDTSLKNLKDVRAYTKMPILGSIPLLENDLVVRRRRRIAWLGWTLSFIIGSAIMAAAIIYYYFTKS